MATNTSTREIDLRCTNHTHIEFISSVCKFTKQRGTVFIFLHFHESLHSIRVARCAAISFDFLCKMRLKSWPKVGWDAAAIKRSIDSQSQGPICRLSRTIIGDFLCAIVAKILACLHSFDCFLKQFFLPMSVILTRFSCPRLHLRKIFKLQIIIIITAFSSQTWGLMCMEWVNLMYSRIHPSIHSFNSQMFLPKSKSQGGGGTLRREKCFEGIQFFSLDSDELLAVNQRFLAAVLEGSACFVVVPVEKVGFSFVLFFVVWHLLSHLLWFIKSFVMIY